MTREGVRQHDRKSLSRSTEMRTRAKARMRKTRRRMKRRTNLCARLDFQQRRRESIPRSKPGSARRSSHLGNIYIVVHCRIIVVKEE